MEVLKYVIVRNTDFCSSLIACVFQDAATGKYGMISQTTTHTCLSTLPQVHMHNTHVHVNQKQTQFTMYLFL